MVISYSSNNGAPDNSFRRAPSGHDAKGAPFPRSQLAILVLGSDLTASPEW